MTLSHHSGFIILEQLLKSKQMTFSITMIIDIYKQLLILCTLALCFFFCRFLAQPCRIRCCELFSRINLSPARELSFVCSVHVGGNN